MKDMYFESPSSLTYNDSFYQALMGFIIKGNIKINPQEGKEIPSDDIISSDIWSSINEYVSDFLAKNPDGITLENIKDSFNEEELKNIINGKISSYKIDSMNLDIDYDKISKPLVSEVNSTEEAENKTNEETKVVKTDEGAKDGQVKCPFCGATDISLNVKTGKLKCRYCRSEFEQEKLDVFEQDVNKLEGEIIGSGAQNISADANDVITLKCTSCGAQVVIDTASANQAKCHWCRNILSINNTIPNGAVPDTLLPFSVAKEDAQKSIEEFVGKRKFFANPRFKEEFTTQNIMGVYFPYMLVDINAHANLKGEGEIETRRYTVKNGDHSETRYDADVYHVERDFDIAIKGLSVESSKDKLDSTNKEKTTNIINAIMPFDTENCVKYNSNYLRGYTSEKRDVNIEDLKPVVEIQSKDIARYSTNDTIEEYDRGVRWEREELTVKGQQWASAYLPVWLYSYMEKKGDKQLLHYVAVNARTKETMGSVPIHMPKLFGISALIELIALIAMMFVDYEYDYVFLAAGVIYFLVIYSKYRNKGARHTYEKETKNSMSNIQKVDQYINHRTGLSSSTISGANNRSVAGQSSTSQIFSNLSKEGIKDNISSSFNSTVTGKIVNEFKKDDK